MIFQGLPVARNGLRLETAPLAILAIKRGLLCNLANFSIFALSSKGCYFSIILVSQGLTS